MPLPRRAAWPRSRASRCPFDSGTHLVHGTSPPKPNLRSTRYSRNGRYPTSWIVPRQPILPSRREPARSMESLRWWYFHALRSVVGGRSAYAVARCRKLFVAGIVTGLGFGALAMAAGESPLQPMAPVSPTIPAPVPPSSHLIRYQNLIPAQATKAGGQPKGSKADNGSLLTIEETGPEMTLGECIAVAVERSPNLKAVAPARRRAKPAIVRDQLRDGLHASEPRPRHPQAAGTARTGLLLGEYQKVHNELVQDVTRLYYSAVYARNSNYRGRCGR